MAKNVQNEFDNFSVTSSSTLSTAGYQNANDNFISAASSSVSTSSTTNGRKTRTQEKRDRSGRSALFRATLTGNLNRMKTLIEDGADVNIQDYAKCSPLHAACLNGHMEAVLCLLENGANVNIKGDNGDTPLHDACENLHEDVVCCLLGFGANPLVSNDSDAVPIDCISEIINDFKEELAQIEIGEEENQKKIEDNLSTALRIKDTLENYTKKVETILLERDECGRSPLHVAVLNNDILTTKKLVSSGADINLRDRFGETPLHIASRLNIHDIVFFFMDKGANSQLKDFKGKYPADLTSSHDIKRLLDTQLQKGQSHSLSNTKTADSEISYREQKKLESYLQIIRKLEVKEPKQVKKKKKRELSHDLYENPIIYSPKKPKEEKKQKVVSDDEKSTKSSPQLSLEKKTLEKTFDKKAIVSIKSPAKNTPIEPLIPETKIKSKRGRKPNPNKKDGHGKTQLHHLCRKGDFDGLKKVVDQCQLDIRDNAGYTPLHEAILSRNYEVSIYLIERKAHVNNVAENGDSILHAAAESGNFELVKLLCEQSANVLCKNTDGKTASESTSNLKISKYLRDLEEKMKPKKEDTPMVFLETKSKQSEPLQKSDIRKDKKEEKPKKKLKIQEAAATPEQPDEFITGRLPAKLALKSRNVEF